MDDAGRLRRALAAAIVWAAIASAGWLYAHSKVRARGNARPRAARVPARRLTVTLLDVVLFGVACSSGGFAIAIGLLKRYD